VETNIAIARHWLTAPFLLLLNEAALMRKSEDERQAAIGLTFGFFFWRLDVWRKLVWGAGS
jgi:hypothetical protein